MFKIHTRTGTYKVRMRASYSHIRSEKAYRKMVQNLIDARMEMSGWKGYAEALQNKLGANNLHDIASLLGHWNYSERISD